MKALVKPGTGEVLEIFVRERPFAVQQRVKLLDEKGSARFETRRVRHEASLVRDWRPDRRMGLPPELEIVAVRPAKQPDPRFHFAGEARYRLVRGEAVEEIATRPRPLAEIKASLRAAVNARREELLRQGAPIHYRGTDFVIDTDEASLLRLLASGVGALAKRLPPDWAWRDRDNRMLKPVVDADVMQLAEQVLGRQLDIFQVSWAKKAEIDALGTIEALIAYDLEAGWDSVAPAPPPPAAKQP